MSSRELAAVLAERHPTEPDVDAYLEQRRTIQHDIQEPTPRWVGQNGAGSAIGSGGNGGGSGSVMGCGSTG